MKGWEVEPKKVMAGWGMSTIYGGAERAEGSPA